MFELRPYQREAVEAVLAEWKKGIKRTLVVLPTGTGKTCVFSKVAEARAEAGDRVLILAHRAELLEQAASKLKTVSGLDSVLEKAESSCLGSTCPVVVGSVQSLSRPERLESFEPDYFGTIIVDEAHHCLSESYVRILDYFSGAFVLGVTATPDRGDMKNLGAVFESLAYRYELPLAVKEGYLCPVKARMIPLKLDIAGVGISSGDFCSGEMGDALEPCLESIADKMLVYCRGRKTVVFLPLIKTSRKLCRLLNERGMSAAEINGDSEERTAILSDFEQGKYQVLCNSMLLTEGWDCPAVDCVVVLRPTKLRSLYTQMVGRGMRLHPGKTELLLLDFLWMTERHDLCRPSALLSRDKDIALAIDKAMENSFEGVDLVHAEQTACSDAVVQRERRLAAELAEMRRRKGRLVNPLQFAVSIGNGELADYSPTFEWESRPPTQKQLECIEGAGISSIGVDSMGKAAAIINLLVKRREECLSTPKQIRCLERYGFRRVGTWTYRQANGMLNVIADCGWRLPYGLEAESYRP